MMQALRRTLASAPGTAIAALALGLSACSVGHQEAGLDNLYDAAWFFGSGHRDRVARLTLLRDSVNNQIADLCRRGASGADLAALDLPDLTDRLEALTEGRVLRVQDSTCATTFPLFLGARREQLGELAREAAANLAGPATNIVEALRANGVDDSMIFHVLWSRIVDQIWDEAWEVSGLEGNLPAVAWVLRPAHRYAVGTNYGSAPGGASLAVTWSPHFTDHLSVFADARWELTQIAWGAALDDDSVAGALRQYGVVDQAGQGRVVAYPISGAFARLLDRFVTGYAAVAGRACDWEDQARRFDVHPGDLFVVLLHEVAYEVFQHLHEAGTLTIPQLLLDGQDRSQAAQLVSIATGDPPGPFDEAMAVFMRAGWHGSPQAVDLFRRALADHPDDVDGRFFLGLSLFDLARYDEAIDALLRVEGLTRGDTTRLRRYDWARIWIGHIYDVRGERAAAIRAYQEVLARPHDSGTMMMGQYGIGPVTAKDWARARVESPFERSR